MAHASSISELRFLLCRSVHSATATKLETEEILRIIQNTIVTQHKKKAFHRAQFIVIFLLSRFISLVVLVTTHSQDKRSNSKQFQVVLTLSKSKRLAIHVYKGIQLFQNPFKYIKYIANNRNRTPILEAMCQRLLHGCSTWLYTTTERSRSFIKQYITILKYHSWYLYQM